MSTAKPVHLRKRLTINGSGVGNAGALLNSSGTANGGYAASKSPWAATANRRDRAGNLTLGTVSGDYASDKVGSAPVG